MVKVCKFGGSSLADANAIKNVAKIIKSDASRRYIIVSAPGKRDGSDVKVTDMLYSCCLDMSRDNCCDQSFAFISQRFKQIVEELGLSVDIDKHLKEVRQNLSADDEAYAASRGEYLNGVILAAYLNYKFIDGAEIIKFNHRGAFNSEYTNDLVKATLADVEYAVIPGFYGSKPDGRIQTFSRGGSDVTGAIIARGVNADLYENWTDVDGFMSADPRIVKNPSRIKKLSYRELRELSYMGASVLHSDAVFPVRYGNIPIEIKNTFNPNNRGTMIVPAEDFGASDNIATGIAGKKDFSIIYVEKQMMNAELGFCRKVLSVLEHHEVSVEHIPTAIDTMCIVIHESELAGKTEKIIKGIKGAVDPDNINITSGVAMIAIVGHGMQSKAGTAGRLFECLGKNGINIRMIDQGSSEINIIIGVENSDFDNSIKVIYDEFFTGKEN